LCLQLPIRLEFGLKLYQPDFYQASLKTIRYFAVISPLFSVKPSQIGEPGLQTPLSTHVTKATLQLATNPTKLLSALSLCHVWPCSYEQHTAPVAVDLKNDESVGSVWKKHCLSLVK